MIPINFSNLKLANFLSKKIILVNGLKKQYINHKLFLQIILHLFSIH